MEPGRSCPPHYGYSPRVFARAADFEAEVIYVAGGLYGNLAALDAIEAMAAAERGAVRLVFNGDFHWFDAEPGLFSHVQRRVMQHTALRGNVETELAAASQAAGCGCAYPESVADADVERSNAILARLKAVALATGCTDELAALAPHAVVQVGDARIAIVHGDAWSLAGWRFSHQALHGGDEAAIERAIERALELGAVDGFACSHTCAPALKSLARGFVVNNGAAGMANFAASTHGLITRIATRSLPAALEAQRVYGLVEAGIAVDALKVDFAAAEWLARFDSIWPTGSPAALSYRERLAHGPDFSVSAALGRAAARCGSPRHGDSPA